MDVHFDTIEGELELGTELGLGNRRSFELMLRQQGVSQENLLSSSRLNYLHGRGS